MKKSLNLALYGCILANFTTFNAVASNPSVVGEVFVGVAFDDTVKQAKKKLYGYCQTLKLFDAKKVSLPVAKAQEQHLLCLNYQQSTQKINEAVFVFGDDKLKMVEAQGGIGKALNGKITDKPMSFMDYQVDFSQFVIKQPDNDTAWLMTKESVHPHLFLWANPYLPSNKDKIEHYVSDVATPQVLPFGANLMDALPLLEQQCKLSYVENIKKVWLANEPEKQTQVNCYGYDYAGFTRKIEAVFGDDILQQAWILTGKGEEDRIRQMLIKRYGEPEFVNEQYEAFNGWQVALRKDKPEVLMLSKELAGIFAKRASVSE